MPSPGRAGQGSPRAAPRPHKQACCVPRLAFRRSHRDHDDARGHNRQRAAGITARDRDPQSPAPRHHTFIARRSCVAVHDQQPFNDRGRPPPRSPGAPTTSRLPRQWRSRAAPAPPPPRSASRDCSAPCPAPARSACQDRDWSRAGLCDRDRRTGARGWRIRQSRFRARPCRSRANSTGTNTSSL